MATTDDSLLNLTSRKESEMDYGFDPKKYKTRRFEEADIDDISQLGGKKQVRRGNIGKGDVAAEPLTITIKRVSAVLFPGDTEKKLKIYFEDYDKPYISNKTNVDLLTMALQSTKPSDWIGHKVRFYFDPDVMMDDQVVGGVRVGSPDEPLPDHVEEYYASLVPLEDDAE